MKKNIRKLLKRLEKENKIKILFAIENGSRAWGMASKDSDYDVRFVYFRKAKDYLKLDKEDDVIKFAMVFSKGRLNPNLILKTLKQIKTF